MKKKKENRFLSALYLGIVLTVGLACLGGRAAPADTADERETVDTGEVPGRATETPAADSTEIVRDEEPVPANRLTPDQFDYRGAFRLPDEFNWGAMGLSYYPGGDGGAGSLFVTGFEGLLNEAGEQCFEGVTGCNGYFAEIAIPAAARAAGWEDLPAAEFIRGMTIFDGGLVQTDSVSYAFVSDITYVPPQGAQTGDKIYGSLSSWYPEGTHGDDTFPTIWFSDLDGGNTQGLFHVGPEEPPYHGRKMGAYLFTVPQAYADRYLGGRILVTGRARGTAPTGSPGMETEGTIAGGSQGPTLIAFRAWGTDKASGDLDALPMLYYRVRYPGCAGPDIGAGGEKTSCDLPGYSMCDDWTGAAFLQAGDRAAIAIVGLKGVTNCYYCGDPEDDAECRTTPLAGECDRYCNESRGYHCGPYRRQVLLYDTEELGRAALGAVDPWTVLPYAVWEPEELYLQSPCCYNMGGMTFDAAGGRMFIVERGLGEGDMNAAVVHVWSVKP
jgi:hypothetical protein